MHEKRLRQDREERERIWDRALSLGYLVSPCLRVKNFSTADTIETAARDSILKVIVNMKVKTSNLSLFGHNVCSWDLSRVCTLFHP